MRPNDKLLQLFAGSVPIQRILLERHDVRAEFESWRRAQDTGNWGTTPEAQARFAVAKASNSSAQLASRTGCRGCDLEAIAKNQALANSIGPARFAAQHQQWFRVARALSPPIHSPLLHIHSEDLTGSLVRCNTTMARVYAFLGLPSMPNNCDVSKIPLEWPCDIQSDPHCSMERYNRSAEVSSP